MKYKVLQLGKYYYEKGGIETVTQSLVAALQNDKLTDVLCFSKGGKTKVSKDGCSTIWEAGSFGKLTTAPLSSSFFSIYKKIRNNYDIILLHAPNPLAAIALLMFPTKAKVIVQWHGDILNKGNFYKLFFTIEQKMLSRADLILATTATYIEYSKALKKNAFKTNVIPLGIDEYKLKSDFYSVNEIKSRYKHRKIVFALGRFVHFKGFEYLIEAAKYLRDDIVVVIGGTGPLKDSYHKIIAADKALQNVHIIIDDGKSNWGNYYKACDVFCLPSVERSESFGLVLLEAMSFSKPLVATNMLGSGTSWVNENGVTGYNVTPRNSKELANAIIKIIDSENYDKLCTNSRKRFDEHFTHTTMINNMVNAFDNLLKL